MTHTIVVESLSRVQLLCDSTNCSLPGSSVHGIFQTRILEKVAISFSRGSSQGSNTGSSQGSNPVSPAMQMDSLPLSHWEAPWLILLNNKKKNNPNKNGQRIWIHISLKKIHMANKQMNRGSTSLAIEGESESEVAQSCPILCDPMDCSLPGSSVHGIFQARILEWVAISFSRGSSRPRDWTWVSRVVGRCFTVWATSEAHWEAQIKVTRSRIVQWLGLHTSTGGGKGSVVGQGTEISQTVGWSQKNFF